MLSEVDRFMEQFGTKTYQYKFYKGTVTLQFDPKSHTYYRVSPDGLVELDGVTDTCQIIDKSMALVPWACKMMAQKILDTVPIYMSSELPKGSWPILARYGEFESLVLAAKSAHREKLDQAAFIGNQAHDWIETYIRAWIAHDGTDIPWAFDVPRDSPQVTSCCLAALDWMGKHNVRWVSTEQKVYSHEFGYAGTMDGLCYVDSCPDTKCCRSPFKDRLSVADWKSSNELRTEYLLQTAAYMRAYVEEHNVDIADRWIIRLGKEDGEFDPWHLEGTSYATDFYAFESALELKRTLAAINERMKERAGEIRQERKEEKTKARKEALTIKCNGADKYKGVRPPQCNGGNPCQSCVARYAERHP